MPPNWHHELSGILDLLERKARNAGCADEIWHFKNLPDALRRDFEAHCHRNIDMSRVREALPRMKESSTAHALLMQMLTNVQLYYPEGGREERCAKALQTLLNVLFMRAGLPNASEETLASMVLWRPTPAYLKTFTHVWNGASDEVREVARDILGLAAADGDDAPDEGALTRAGGFAANRARDVLMGVKCPRC